MPTPIVILGAGGHGREIVDLIVACNRAGTADFVILGFIVDTEYIKSSATDTEVPILGDFDWLARQTEKITVIGGVGSPALRQRMINQASLANVQFATLVHPGAITMAPLEIGAGSVLAAGCILTNRVRLGNHVHINVGCTISHDVVIEDFTTIAPGAHIAGNVHIGSGCFVGIGVNIIEKKRIGQRAIIGAGSVIVRDVPAYTTVVGNPGRIIKRHL